MIENIVTIKLNVDEELTINKNTLRGAGTGLAVAVDIDGGVEIVYFTVF